MSYGTGTRDLWWQDGRGEDESRGRSPDSEGLGGVGGGVTGWASGGATAEGRDRAGRDLIYLVARSWVCYPEPFLNYPTRRAQSAHTGLDRPPDRTAVVANAGLPRSRLNRAYPGCRPSKSVGPVFPCSGRDPRPTVAPTRGTVAEVTVTPSRRTVRESGIRENQEGSPNRDQSGEGQGPTETPTRHRGV